MASCKDCDTDNSLDSRRKFFKSVKKHNADFRISPGSYLYKKIMEKHRSCKNNRLLNDDEFTELVYVTLIAWGMNKRRAKLVPFKKFKKSIYKNKRILKELYSYHLIPLKKEEMSIVLAKIKELFISLKVMESDSKIVGLSKTLHFLMPDLIMPIDRKYTMRFFKLSVTKDNEFETFEKIFRKFHCIAERLKLSNNDINKVNWNTSVPKLIDNALIALIGLKKSQ